MKKRGTPIVSTILDIILESCAFITVRYLIGCCRHAFEESIIFVFFFALDIYIIVEYWKKLEKNISNKLWRVIAFVMTFVVLLLVVCFVGYLKIVPVFERW